MSGANSLRERLLDIGRERYHDRHPFNQRMHDGTLSSEEIRTWVRNRYYYQTRIPIKDSLIVAKARDPRFRREWVQRIHDHDGLKEGEGGLELWLTLADAVGLDRESVANLEHVLPGVRRSCDAYVAFVDEHDLLESVAASLTELFAGGIMKTRIAAFEQHYPWVRTEGLSYFQTRTQQAPRDGEWGLAYVLEHATSDDEQQRCEEALRRKCEILWSLLDAVEAANRCPRLSPHAQLRRTSPAAVVLPERAVELNPTGLELLELCDGQRTVLEIAIELAARNPDAAGAFDDAHGFLDQMQELGVIAA
jgi:pyrroloquinoline-quinone synthase